MNKLLSIPLLLLLSVALTGCGNTGYGAQPDEAGQRQEVPQQTGEAEEEAVTNLVEGFGKQLKQVSLLAPEDVVSKSMQEHYGDLVSPELLAKWQRHPQNAPGRLTSSPWPDRIEITSIQRRSETSHEVQGDVIEITSVENTSGGVAARRPIKLVVTRSGDRWLIDSVTLGNHEQAESVVYVNKQFGFRFSLPESWNGYSIVTNEWEGRAVEGQRAGEVVETGAMISIRHPRWTSEHPRQDIPIMIFTHAQWDALQQGDLHIGAAPIGPKELVRNARYVFALPARYNYAFPTGYEEVEKILESNPLQPDETPQPRSAACTRPRGCPSFATSGVGEVG